MDAIEETEVFVVLLSSSANASIHVANETERAVNYRKMIIPVRLEDVKPSRAIELHISARQWVDLFESDKQREQNMRSFLDVLRDSLRSWLVPDLPPLSTGGLATAPLTRTPEMSAYSPDEDEMSFGENRLVDKAASDPPAKFWFNAEKDDVVTARLIHGGGQEAVIEIRGPHGRPLATSSGYFETRIDAEVLPVSGRYSILFGPRTKANALSFTAFLQRANNPGFSKTLRYGRGVPGSVSVAGAVNTYTVACEADDDICIEVRNVSNERFCPCVNLYDPEGNLIEKVSSGLTGQPDVPVLKYRVAIAGDHTILVCGHERLIGPYKIIVTKTN